VESSCECSNEPLGSIECWELSSGLSGSAQRHRVSWLVTRVYTGFIWPRATTVVVNMLGIS
jgi:hypothetical protein